MERLEYNYVFFGIVDDFVVYAFRALFDHPNVKIMPPKLDTENSFLNFLYRLHFSPRLNKIIPVPFKNIWNKWLFRQKFNNHKPICFVFYGHYKRFPKSFLSYLKKHYEKAKFVVYHDDIAPSNYGIFDYGLKKQIDLFITYDQKQAKQDKCLYYPTVFSSNYSSNDNLLITSDIYFLGRGKNRLEYIYNLVEKLVKSNFVCDIYLLDVPYNQRRNDLGIHYLEKKMPYEENINHILRTKCVMDVTQQGSRGFTYRLWESIAFDKHLLTNNNEILSSKYYDENLVHIIDENSFDADSFKKCINTNFVNGKKKLIHPYGLLEFIDNQLKTEE